MSYLNLPWHSELLPEIEQKKKEVYESFVANQIPLIQLNLLPTQVVPCVIMHSSIIISVVIYDI